MITNQHFNQILTQHEKVCFYFITLSPRRAEVKTICRKCFVQKCLRSDSLTSVWFSVTLLDLHTRDGWCRKPCQQLLKSENIATCFVSGLVPQGTSLKGHAFLNLAYKYPMADLALCLYVRLNRFLIFSHFIILSCSISRWLRPHTASPKLMKY